MLIVLRVILLSSITLTILFSNLKSQYNRVKNSLSPRWSKPIFLNISDPTEPGLISLTIKDDNLNKSNPRDDVFMGNAIIDISRIISCAENDERCQVQLNNGNGE